MTPRQQSITGIIVLILVILLFIVPVIMFGLEFFTVRQGI